MALLVSTLIVAVCTVSIWELFLMLCYICQLLLFLHLFCVRFVCVGAVPFLSMLGVLALWFCISVPLVFLGAYFGYKKDALEFPVVTSNIPRQIPEQPWYLNPAVTCMLGGILPFGACFVELFFIMSRYTAAVVVVVVVVVVVFIQISMYYTVLLTT